MTTLQQRKRRGEEVLKKYKTGGADWYACAVDAIADILLFAAQTEAEATQLLHTAEMDYRNAAESESFMSEG